MAMEEANADTELFADDAIDGETPPFPGPIQIIDLTSDLPTERYWANMAKKRKEAWMELEMANRELQEKISVAQTENQQLKVVLEETTEIVEALQEIVKEQQEDKKMKNKENKEENNDTGPFGDDGSLYENFSE